MKWKENILIIQYNEFAKGDFLSSTKQKYLKNSTGYKNIASKNQETPDSMPKVYHAR